MSSASPAVPQIKPGPGGWPVWGHDHAVHELRSAIVRGVRHAYILSGYDHVGKASLAREFAKALICERAPAPGLSCGDCAPCRRVVRGTHPDVTLYDLERQQQSSEKSSTSKNLSLTIQTVRQITSSISLRPMEARHRVVIVDDVESMQETAQEAFLKTLEEPPSFAVILLLTTDAELLLETIRSRAVTIQLQTVPAATIAAMLSSAGIEHDLAGQVAAASLGRPGWALKAVADEKLLSDRLEIHSSVMSWIHGDQYQRMAEATRMGDAFSKDRDSVYARLVAAQSIWRTFLMRAVGAPDIEVPGMMSSSEGAIDPAGAVRALKSVEACLADLDANVRPRLALQSMVLQWPTS
jgi:DNA polymerase-3 subunit delta'